MPMIALSIDISTNCRSGIMPFRDIIDSENDFSAVGGAVGRDAEPEVENRRARQTSARPKPHVA